MHHLKVGEKSVLALETQKHTDDLLHLLIQKTRGDHTATQQCHSYNWMGCCRALLSPVVWPTSVLLDWILGRDIGNVYSREELKRLIDIHTFDPDAQAESGLTRADQRLIIGALDYKTKR